MSASPTLARLIGGGSASRTAAVPARRSRRVLTLPRPTKRHYVLAGVAAALTALSAAFWKYWSPKVAVESHYNPDNLSFGRQSPFANVVPREKPDEAGASSDTDVPNDSGEPDDATTGTLATGPDGTNRTE